MVLESQTVKGCAAKYQALHLIGGWMIKENSRQFIHFNLCLWLGAEKSVCKFYITYDKPPAQRDNNCFTNEMEGGGRTSTTP
jgi:hypothetical protein